MTIRSKHHRHRVLTIIIIEHFTINAVSVRPFPWSWIFFSRSVTFSLSKPPSYPSIHRCLPPSVLLLVATKLQPRFYLPIFPLHVRTTRVFVPLYNMLLKALSSFLLFPCFSFFFLRRFNWVQTKIHHNQPF